MTFFHPPKNSLFTAVLLAMGALTVLGAFVLVLLYSRNVERTHRLQETRAGIQAAEVRNAELRERILSLFTSDAVERFAAARGLVRDTAPEYFKLTQEWGPALRY
ncbi:MAG: hypothetical protein HY436_01670 [Candidatus Liptonbacteria bacterium]|nr:hypothetical protein [Candidatus Liptonbacteria bacterium]